MVQRFYSTGVGGSLAIILMATWQWNSAAAAENYLAHVQRSIAQARSNLTALTSSAEHAAGEFVSGGNLWVGGRQPDFIAEACGRAGGLMASAPLGQRVPGRHDVILYAVPGSIQSEDLKVIGRWEQEGATAITFSSSAGLYRDHFPIDTVANVIELWAWTGEFVAASSRLGKMPILYQSYGLPGGPERGKKYEGKKFHDDLTIKPIAAGVLGRRYLDRIQHMLVKLGESQSRKILKAANWWQQTNSVTILLTGHMFPSHAQDPRTLPLGSLVAVPAWEDKDLLDPNRPPQFVLYLGYQFTPRKLLDQVKAMGVKLVYTDVQAAPRPEPTGNVLYIEPGWPMADGCVEVPGYDVPILPASGVVQAAIYWSLASERGR